MAGTLHILKLSVGSESIESLAEWHEQRIAQALREKKSYTLWHRTRMFPRRGDEVLNGGSVYWVIKGTILCRQRLLGLEPVTGEDGIERCDFVLDNELVPVRPTPKRPFQGWRYLKPTDAPPDLSGLGGAGLAELPAAMRAQLAELGLI